MPLLTRDAILQVEDLKRELVSVPEWGGDVFVRSLNGAERDKFEASVLEQRGKSQKMNLENIRAKMASMTICDEHGNRLFSDGDIQALAKKNAAALDRVFSVARRLSGLGENEVEELAKGLEADPFGGSPSG